MMETPPTMFHISPLHCLNLDAQVTQTVGRNATDLFMTSRELPEYSGIYFKKGIILQGKFCEKVQIIKQKL